MGRKTNIASALLGVLMFVGVAPYNPAGAIAAALLFGGGLWLLVNGTGSWLRGGEDESVTEA